MAVLTVGTLIMGLSVVKVGVSVVVGRVVVLVKKLGVIGTAAPSPVMVMATGSFVVCVERVVGVSVSDKKVNGASAIVDVESGVFVGDVTKGNNCDPSVGLESADTSVLELAEPSVVLERFPVPRTMDPVGVIPLRLEVMDCLSVWEAPIADWAPFPPSLAAVAVGEVDEVVVASVEEDGEVVSVIPDVDGVVAVEAVEISVLGLGLAVAVLRRVSERESGTTSMPPAPELAVLVVFLKGAICRLLIISLALMGWIYADLQLVKLPVSRERTSRGEGRA
jgi:hypothetical protein